MEDPSRPPIGLIYCSFSSISHMATSNFYRATLCENHHVDQRFFFVSLVLISYEPWSTVAILGMVIQPLIGNPYNGYITPYYWVDDHPLLYGNNGSLDPSTYSNLNASRYTDSWVLQACKISQYYSLLFISAT